MTNSAFRNAVVELQLIHWDLKRVTSYFLLKYLAVLYLSTCSYETLSIEFRQLLTLKYEDASMSSRRYNIGVIGYGLSAKVFHIPLILTVPDFKLHAIVQRSPKPDDNAEKDHPGVKVWRSADEMVIDEKLDVVVVTTAPDTHPSLAKLALEAGKHGVPQSLVSEADNSH